MAGARICSSQHGRALKSIHDGRGSRATRLSTRWRRARRRHASRWRWELRLASFAGCRGDAYGPTRARHRLIGCETCDGLIVDAKTNAMNAHTAWGGERAGSVADLRKSGASARCRPAFRSGCSALRVGSAAAPAPDWPRHRGDGQSLGDRGAPARDRWTNSGSTRIPVLSRQARPRSARLHGLARANLDGTSAVVRACVDSYATAIAKLVSLSANVDTKDADEERSSTRYRHVFRRPGWRRVAASMAPEACTPIRFLESLSGPCPR